MPHSLNLLLWDWFQLYWGSSLTPPFLGVQEHWCFLLSGPRYLSSPWSSQTQQISGFSPFPRISSLHSQIAVGKQKPPGSNQQIGPDLIRMKIEVKSCLFQLETILYRVLLVLPHSCRQPLVGDITGTWTSAPTWTESPYWSSGRSCWDWGATKLVFWGEKKCDLLKVCYFCHFHIHVITNNNVLSSMQWIQGLQVLVERWFSLFINTWFEERPKYWSCEKKKCTAVSTCNLWIESGPNTGVVHVHTGAD